MSSDAARRIARLLSRHGDAAGSIASAFAMQTFLVVSGVIAARALGVEDRGHFALVSITPVIMTQVATLGLPLAATYFIANESVAPARLLRRLARLLAALTAVLLGVHWAVLFIALRGQNHDVALAGLATAIVAPGVVCQLFGLSILQGQQRFRAFNLLRPFPLLVHGVVLATLFVLGIADLPMVTLSWAASTLACGVLVLALALGAGETARQGMGVEPPSTGRMLRFGLKSLGGHVTPVETFRVDQLVAGLFLGPAALGLYVIGLSFTNLPRMIGQSVGMVAYPRVAASASSPAVRRTVLKFVGAVTLVNSLLVAVLALAAGWLVPFFFGADFADAVPIVRVLLLYSLIVSVRRVLIDALRGIDQGGPGSLGEIASWPILALGLIVLPSEVGAIGVAWALILYSTASLLVAAGFSYSRAFNASAALELPGDGAARLHEVTQP